MFALLLATTTMGVAEGNVTASPPPPSPPPGLTPCQTCAQPGGDCSVAYKNGPGVHCGTIGGNAYCCPNDAYVACHRSYNAYTCRQIRDDSFGDGGLITLVLSFGLLVCAFSACARQQRRRRPALASQQGYPAQQGYPVNSAGVEMQSAVTGIPVGSGAQQSGMPIATAVGQPVSASGYPQAQGYPAAQQQGPTVVHHHHPSYGMGYGYGGGSVAMGAGMGFLGGMMLADVGHHGGYGGGDFGGGGDFAADM